MVPTKIFYLLPGILVLAVTRAATIIQWNNNSIISPAPDYTITYQRNGVDYFLNDTMAITEFSSRGRYTISYEPSNPELDSFHIQFDGAHLFIDSYSRLYSKNPNYPLKRSNFRFTQIDPENSLYNITIKESGEGLVTPSAGPPYTFYIQSRFPTEPVATFKLTKYKIDVDYLYGGMRSNIIRTARIIHESTAGNQTQLYRKLFEGMVANNHIVGAEIFGVGGFIFKDLGETDDLFSELPSQVQIISSGQPARIWYIKDENTNSFFPMKYYWAVTNSEGNSQEILPYSFTPNLERDPVNWSINYAGDHELFVDVYGGSPYPVIERLSATRIFNFELHLSEGLASFALGGNSNYPISTGEPNDPIAVTFSRYWHSDGKTPANFLVRAY